MIFRKSWMKWLLLLSVFVSVCVLVPATLAFMFDQAGPIVNTFAPPKGLDGQAPLQISITKQIINEGEGTMSPAGFQFALEDIVTGKVLNTVSDAKGNANFQLFYSGTDAGKTFRYSLYEVNTGVKHVTYSDTRYTVTVQVGLENEKLVAKVQLDGNPAEQCTVTFVNRYCAAVDAVPPSTGDQAQPALYMLLVALGAAGIILMYGSGQRQRWIDEE